MTQFVSPQLFGREREAGALRHWLQADGAGRRPMLLVGGEAGIGKSRLIEEALGVAAADGTVQLRATCLEGDEGEPYAMIRSLLVAAGGRAADVNLDPAPEAERQVRQVQQGLTSFLRQLCRERPLLLIVEDLHWSDAPSLEVLLALGLESPPPSLLLSYRPQPAAPGLSRFLADGSRLRLAQTVALQPLAAADVGRMVRALLGLQEPLPAALLHEVMAATEGVPFLVEEVVHTLVQRGDLQTGEGGWRFRRGAALVVPASLRHSIEARLLAQARDVVQVAELAAVLGQDVDVGRLGRLAGLEETALFAALRELAAAQILVRRQDGALAFRHALTREALRTRLLPAERRAYHRRVAQMLEEEGESGAAMLAYHWAKGGQPQRAARHAWQAGQAAAAVHAHREAIAHFEMALDGEYAGREDAARETILMLLGDQHAALGEPEQAIARYREAQSIYRDGGEHTTVATLELRIGAAYGNNRYMRGQAAHHLQTAFEALPEAHPERWQAGLLLGLQQAAMGDYGAAEATFLAAHGAAPGAAGEEALPRLRVAYELGGLRALRGEWQALEEAAQRVLTEAPQASDEGLALRHDAHAALGTVAYYRGTLQGSLAHFSACLEIATQRGLSNDQALARWNLATNALYHLGRWHEAREHLAELPAVVTRDLAQMAILFEGWMDGQWEEVAATWLAIWPELVASDDLEVQMAFGRRIADVLLALGRPQEALALLTPLVARLWELEARSFLLQLLPRQVEAMARTGEGQAEEVAKRGLAMARELGGRPAEGLLLRGRAMARCEREQWLEAFADFEEAMGILEALPMPYEAARTQREAGLARLARGRRGDRKRAARLLRQARQQFADLGARRDENATEAILSAAGLAGEEERGPGPLTAREQEVAELVTQGLSNREIAAQLFITEKTAAYHVGNILNKLDFNSRAQIAAYVAQGK